MIKFIGLHIFLSITLLLTWKAKILFFSLIIATERCCIFFVHFVKIQGIQNHEHKFLFIQFMLLNKTYSIAIVFPLQSAEKFRELKKIYTFILLRGKWSAGGKSPYMKNHSNFILHRERDVKRAEFFL